MSDETKSGVNTEQRRVIAIHDEITEDVNRVMEKVEAAYRAVFDLHMKWGAHPTSIIGMMRRGMGPWATITMAEPDTQPPNE